MEIEFATFILGFVIMVLGLIGNPSSLDKPVNTATAVFLTGVLITVLAVLKLE